MGFMADYDILHSLEKVGGAKRTVGAPTKMSKKLNRDIKFK